MICHQIRLRGDDSFSYWLKKKAQDISCSRMRAWIFCVKRCTVWIFNVVAQIGLEINSLGDVSLQKERASLLQ